MKSTERTEIKKETDDNGQWLNEGEYIWPTRNIAHDRFLEMCHH